MNQKKDQKVVSIKEEALAAPKKEKELPAIPDNRIDEVIDLSANQAMFAKVVEGGFRILNQDKFIKAFVGKIVDVAPYLIKFENGIPEKKPNVQDDLQIPPGFERRCDVRILCGDQLIGLSLPKSSTKYYLSPYLKFLKNKGLRPEGVLTKVTSKMVSNAQGTWAVACFELVDNPELPQDSSQVPPEWE
jgi:hypothetical protein